MRRTTLPPETFFQSSPISSRTRCHDDPSGAGVAILMTVAPAPAATGKEKRKRGAAAPAAALFQKEFIHPPHQPSRLALRQEMGKAEPRGLPPRVEGKRPGKKPQELLLVLRAPGDRLGERPRGGNLPPASEFHRALEVAFRLVQGSPHRLGAPPLERDEVLVNRAVVVVLLQRKGSAHERFTPGQVGEHVGVGPREGDRKAPGSGGPEQQGDILPSRHRRRPLRVGRKPFPEAGMCGLETPHAILLRPQEEALRPVRAGVRPPPAPFPQRPPLYDKGPGRTSPGRPQKEQGDHRRERTEPISRWMPPPGERFPSPRLPSGPVPGAGTVSGETPKIPRPRLPRSSPDRRTRWPGPPWRRGRSGASPRPPPPPASGASSCQAGRGRSPRPAPGRDRPPPSRRTPPGRGIRRTPAWRGAWPSRRPRRP